MNSFNNHGWNANAYDDDSSSKGSGFSWNSFLVAAVVTLIAVNWGFLRPAARQLEQMKRQVYSLEKTISKLTQKHGEAHKTSNLLDVLNAQAVSNDAAAESLSRIADLHDRLLAEADELQAAHEALANLTNLRKRVEESNSLLANATDALDKTRQLQDRILSVAAGADEAEGVLQRVAAIHHKVRRTTDHLVSTSILIDEVDDLQTKVSEMAPTTGVASEVVDKLVEMNERLNCECSSNSDALTALNDLVDIKNQIYFAAGNIKKSQTALSDLIELKDDVLLEADNIPRAIETLEQTVDLQDQLLDAKRSFTQLQAFVGKVILMEPTLQRAMTTLEPLTQLGALRRMTTGELRHAASIIKNQRREQFAGESDDDSQVTTVARKDAAESKGSSN